MKRIARPAAEPEILTNFRTNNPNGTWKPKKASGSAAFQPEPGSYAVFTALAEAQGYLCAFCEIRVERGLWGQVEHFVPEDFANIAWNCALDFGNMVACCEGGTQSKIPNGRSVPPIRDTQHCGQLKGNHDPRAITHANGRTVALLDPRGVPAFPCLWKFGSQGQIAPHPTACTAAGVDVDAAQATVDRFGLDRSGLRGMREAVLVELDSDLEARTADGSLPMDAAMAAIAAEQLLPVEGKLARFWSTVRDWAGNAAEQVLGAHGHKIPGMT